MDTMIRTLIIVMVVIVPIVFHTAAPAVAAQKSSDPSDNTASNWLDDIIMYGVVPRHFGPKGFQSVTERMDDLADLGVNVLWLSPVNVTPANEYGYAVIDYFALRPDYGTEDDFRAMIKAAHERDMKVLMDMVPNHTSSSHPYFQDSLAQGTASPYYDYYDRSPSGHPRHYFNWTHLPNLNYDNPKVRSWMLDVLTYWVREFDIDGYRIDVAWGLKQRAPDFWPQVRTALEQIKPDILLIAEASARDAYYFHHGYDAAYDWTDQLGQWAWQNVFDGGSGPITERLHEALTNRGRGYDPAARIVRFLNNNDTGQRFISRYGYHTLKVATAMLFTLPGIPTLFTGDEVAATYDPYVNTGPINWGDWLKLRPYHQKLIHLRKTTPSLKSPLWERVSVSYPQDTVYAYVRFTEKDDPLALVMLNFADEDVDARIELPSAFASLSQAVDRLSDDTLVWDDKDEKGHVVVPLQKGQARIIMAP